MSERAEPMDDRKGLLLAVSSIIVALVVITANAVLFSLPNGWWISPDLPFPLSLITFAVLPTSILLVLYPIFLSRTAYRYPVKLDDVLDQLSFTVLLLGGAMVAEITIVYFVAYTWSVIRPPGSGGTSLVGAGWAFVVLFPATSITVLIGLPAIIISTYVAGKIIGHER